MYPDLRWFLHATSRAGRPSGVCVLRNRQVNMNTIIQESEDSTTYTYSFLLCCLHYKPGAILHDNVPVCLHSPDILSIHNAAKLALFVVSIRHWLWAELTCVSESPNKNKRGHTTGCKVGVIFCLELWTRCCPIEKTKALQTRRGHEVSTTAGTTKVAVITQVKPNEC